jgi:hypothetical protein
VAGECWVYFVQAEAGGPIKIGLTTNPDRRLAVLQTSSPLKLRYTRLLEGDRKREQRYHDRWRRHRLWGEWFEAVDGLARFAHAVPASESGSTAEASAAFEKGWNEGWGAGRSSMDLRVKRLERELFHWEFGEYPKDEAA